MRFKENREQDDLFLIIGDKNPKEHYDRISVSEKGVESKVIFETDFINKLHFNTCGLVLLTATGSEIYYMTFHPWARCTSAPMGMTNVYSENIAIALEGHDDSTGELILGGRVVHKGLHRPTEIAHLNETFFYMGTNGLYSAKNNKLIKETGDADLAAISGIKSRCGGLAKADGKLYFGGVDGTVYCYDGKKVESIFAAGFPIYTIHGIENNPEKVLYIGGSGKKGILALPTTHLDKAQTILEKSVNEAFTITSVDIPSGAAAGAYDMIADYDVNHDPMQHPLTQGMIRHRMITFDVPTLGSREG